MTASSPTSRKSGPIDELMERASRALADTDYFEAEGLAADALRKAHRLEDYERMARILLPLQEARRQKRLIAQDAAAIFTLSDPDELAAARPEPGCWLIEPPLVGASGRDFRDRADKQRVPAIVIVREPAKEREPRRGWWPIVMLGPVVVRTAVPPPEKLDVEWFIEASEKLGEEAIAAVDPQAPPESRVDKLMERLETVRDHEELHQELQRACHDAAHARAAERERTDSSSDR